MHLKHWQVWSTDHLCRKPVPVYDHPVGKEILSNIQCEPLLVQFWTLPVHLVTGAHEEEISTFLSVPLLGSCREQPVCLSACFSPNQTSPKSSATTHRTFLQPLKHLCCPPLNPFEFLHILLKLWVPELHKAHRWGCTSPEHSGMIPSFGWLFMVCSMCPRMCFASQQ